MTTQTIKSKESVLKFDGKFSSWDFFSRQTLGFAIQKKCDWILVSAEVLVQKQWSKFPPTNVFLVFLDSEEAKSKLGVDVSRRIGAYIAAVVDRSTQQRFGQDESIDDILTSDQTITTLIDDVQGYVNSGS